MPGTTEQRRQRRLVAGVVAGALALGAVGVAGSILVTSGPCDHLLPGTPSPEAVTDGGVVIGEVAPGPEGDRAARAVVAAGDELGLGPARGATASGVEDLTLLPFGDGSFVVADADRVRIVDTAIIAVATGRARPADTRIVSTGDQLALLVTDDDAGTLVARYDGDLKLTACRRIDPGTRILEVDGGVAVLGRSGDVEAVRLDGGSLWSSSDLLSSSATDAAVTAQLAVVAGTSEVVGVGLRSGEVAWRTPGSALPAPLTDAPLLLAGDDVVLVATERGVTRIDGGTGEVLGSTETAVAPTDAVTTSAGVAVVAGDELVLVDREGTEVVELPGTATGAAAARGEVAFVPTTAGLVAIDGDGRVTVASDLDAVAVSTSDDFTIVEVDVGDGFLAFYGPASPVG